MSEGKLSSRGARIVKVLSQFADDLAAGSSIETKYTVPPATVMQKPSRYPPARVRAVRELVGASQEVFAQLLAVSPMTIRSWEQGSRQPSPPPQQQRRFPVLDAESYHDARTVAPGYDVY